jgi:hypothetical protein
MLPLLANAPMREREAKPHKQSERFLSVSGAPQLFRVS